MGKIKKGGKKNVAVPVEKEAQESKKVKNGDILKLKKNDKMRGGGEGPPMSLKKKESIKAARMSIATGELATSEMNRKKEQDLRTLYVRFKENFPSSETQIREIDDGIKHVRVPRQANIKGKKAIKYAFVEFASENEAVKAKEKLTANNSKKIYVDFVGEKSKNGSDKRKSSSLSSSSGGGNKKAINPIRLFVNGLGPGVTVDVLKKLFPKCKEATIPKKKKKMKFNTFGFVEFHNPADAKAAFDASKDINVEGHHIVVLYARINDKRKIDKNTENQQNDSSIPQKKPKVDVHVNEKKRKRSNSEDDDDENQSSDDQEEEDDMEVENDEEQNDDEGEVEAENDDSDEDEVENDDDDEDDEEEGDDDDNENDDEGEVDDNNDDDDDDEGEGDDDDDHDDDEEEEGEEEEDDDE